ncbi:MAG: hypothetical protein FD124_3631 [Alphaproteobacteria bacterium]|nr:MAG: hypothetical protein FD124_3631 [Alphaproteobacteria bacterium]
MVRLYTRGIALKSFAEMRRALDDLDAVVATAIARVPKAMSTGGLKICAPPAVGVVFTAPAPATKGADTS